MIYYRSPTMVTCTKNFHKGRSRNLGPKLLKEIPHFGNLNKIPLLKGNYRWGV